MRKINSKLTALMLISVFVLINLSAMALVKSPPEKAILPNGLRVIVVEDKSLPVVAAGLILNNAPYFLEKGNDGMGSIYQALMETADFTDESRFDFNAALEKVGIAATFAGSRRMLYVACNGNNDNLGTILNSLYKLSFSLKPSTDNFDKAKDSVLRQMKTAVKYPRTSGYMEQLAWNDLYPDHAHHGNGPIDQEKLEKLQFENIKDYSDRILRPNNAVLVIIGDVNASEVFKAAMKQFGELQASEVCIDKKVADEKSTRSRKIENIDFYDIDETEVVIAFEAPGYNEPEMAAAYLWQASLHDINNSWLEYTIKKDFPELKNLFARYSYGRNRGIFVIGFTSKEADVNRPVNYILNSIANIANDPPKANELSRLVNMMQLKNLEQRESRLDRAFELGMAEMMGNYRLAEGISAALSRVVPGDMKKTGRAHVFV